MVPEHASTQGFVWPTVLFYLVVDAMLGTTAYLTRSILPGIVIHTIGLTMFFGLIWPHDHERVSIWMHGPDLWFWIHTIQAVGFGVLAIAAFRRLAGMSGSNAPEASFAHRAALAA